METYLMCLVWLFYCEHCPADLIFGADVYLVISVALLITWEIAWAEKRIDMYIVRHKVSAGSPQFCHRKYHTITTTAFYVATTFPSDALSCCPICRKIGCLIFNLKLRTLVLIVAQISQISKWILQNITVDKQSSTVQVIDWCQCWQSYCSVSHDTR